MATIGSLIVNLIANTASFSAGMKKSATDVKQLETRVQAASTHVNYFSAILGGVGVVAIGAFSKSAIKAASDAEETSSKFSVVFRDIGNEARAAADLLDKSYGLARTQSKRLLSDTGDLLTGFGFSQKAALGLSTEVNKLAVDLASFTNFSGGAEGASQALTKALLGERDSLKALGVSILEEDVKLRVAANGAKGMTFETERQAKAFATLQIAQEQSKNAIGDYSRTQDGFANQMRELSASAQDLKEDLGQMLLPFARAVVSSIKFLVQYKDALRLVVSSVGLVVGAIVAYKVAAVAATTAQIALLAVSGPGGWAVLAGAVIAAGTAVAGLSWLLEDAGTKAVEASAKAADATKGLNQTASVAQARAAAPSRGASVSNRIAAIDVTQFKDEKTLLEAINKEAGSLSFASLEVKRAYEEIKGIQLSIFRDRQKQLKVEEAEREKIKRFGETFNLLRESLAVPTTSKATLLADRRNLAQRYFDETRTAAEKYRLALKDIADLEKHRIITPAQAARFRAFEMNRLQGAGDASAYRPVAGLERGSSEAYSAILRSRGNPLVTFNETAKQQLKTQQEIAANTRKAADSGSPTPVTIGG